MSDQTSADEASASGPSPTRGHGAGHYGWRRLVAVLAIVLAVLLVGSAAFAGIYLWRADAGIKRSSAIATKKGTTRSSDLNLLVMGLDSRLDVNGNALPADIYNALHAGDSSDGGLNANVLMYVHIPADGSKATVIAIPRDDYVDLPGCPDGECKGKIKEAYGLAADQKTKELTAQDKTGASAYQESRDAGRAEEVATVEQFLGVSIDHFIEVTMVAFLQIAQVVQPITVCVKENTVDTYSGADFKAGVQQIDANQAVAFVRQRRDTSNAALEFTDLDRSRRQQAFIASLLTKLKQTNFLTNPTKLNALVKVAQQNTVIDSGLGISELTSLATSLDGSKMSYYTLPIESFGTDSSGQSVNIVDTTTIRAIVSSLLGSGTSSTPSASSPTSAPATQDGTTWGKGTTVSVVNASGVQGAAGNLVDELGSYGFTAGTASNATDLSQSSTISYGAGSQQAAARLASLLGGLTTVQDDSLSADQVQVSIGTSFDWSSSASATSSSASASSEVPSAVQATGGGSTGPQPTQLTEMIGGGIPCVK